MPVGVLEYVRATVGPVVSMENVLLVGALDELPAASVVAERDTVAVPSLYVVPFAWFTV